MSEDSREERLQIMLTADELSVIDDFRFKQRMPSRAAAVRELLRRGIAAEGYPPLVAHTKSSDFGVMNGAPADASRKPKEDKKGNKKRGAASEAVADGS